MFIFLILLFVANGALFSLRKSDFANGSYHIQTPGAYVLKEDISFNPNPTKNGDAYHAGFPRPDQLKSNGGQYDDQAFGLGFFAALIISVPNVIINLNNHRIEQSEEHALLQRFFAVIELADQPFIPGQGPHNFGFSLNSAENILICNGVIGRSSHHGIHGNGNKNIQIRNVLFNGYEVGALALNGVDGLIVKNSNAINRKDVPVLGTFSSARFIRPYIDYLHMTNSSTTLRVMGNILSVSTIRTRLINAINNVFEDVITDNLHYIDQIQHTEEYNVFHNAMGLLDGNSYAFLTNKFGVAVNGFPNIPTTYSDVPSNNIEFKNIQVIQHEAFINEIVSIRKGGVVRDPIGAVFQVKNQNPSGDMNTVTSPIDSFAEYKGNIIANVQALVAKAILNHEFDFSGLDTSRGTIDESVINWIEEDPGTPESKLSTLVADEGYLCNGDSMFHVNKGVISFKIDATKNVLLKDISIIGLRNHGDMGSVECGNYSISHPQATQLGYGGANVRGFSFAGSSNVELKNIQVDDVYSNYGNTYGIDIFTDTDKIKMRNVQITNLTSMVKKSIGVHFGPETIACKLDNWCITELNGPIGTLQVSDEGTNNLVSKSHC